MHLNRVLLVALVALALPLAGCSSGKPDASPTKAVEQDPDGASITPTHAGTTVTPTAPGSTTGSTDSGTSSGSTGQTGSGSSSGSSSGGSSSGSGSSGVDGTTSSGSDDTGSGSEPGSDDTSSDPATGTGSGSSTGGTTGTGSPKAPPEPFGPEPDEYGTPVDVIATESCQSDGEWADVAYDQDMFQWFWEDCGHVGTAPALDFNKVMVVLYAWGEQPTSGYTLDVEPQVLSDGSWQAYIRLIYPGDDCIVSEVTTHPGEMVIVELYEGDLPFEIADWIQPCS